MDRTDASRLDTAPYMRRRHDPKSVGERSEGMVLAALLRAGEQVLVPFGDNQRYDLVVDRGDHMLRLQVKTGRLVTRGSRSGTIAFPTCSSQAHRRNGVGGRRDYAGQADYFGVYCPETDGVYFVPVSACGRREAVLRVTPPVRQLRRVSLRWARDHVMLP